MLCCNDPTGNPPLTPPRLLYAHKFAKGGNALIEGNIGIEFGDESLAQSFRTGIRGMQHNTEGVYALTPLRKGVNALKLLRDFRSPA